MSHTAIKLTEFRVEKLQCMGGAGKSSPFRITLYEGLTLGQTGSVAEAMLEAANQDNFAHQLPMGFKRLLTMLGM